MLKKVDGLIHLHILLESKPSYGCYSNQEIRNIKDQVFVAGNLVFFSSLYRKLINYCDKRFFFEAVQVANEFYALIEKNKDDIVDYQILQNEVLNHIKKKTKKKKTKK